MNEHQPTTEMRKFAREVLRISALNRSGLSTGDDIDRLAQIGDTARTTQRAVNAKQDRTERG